jgi:hypothetical protein
MRALGFQSRLGRKQRHQPIAAKAERFQLLLQGGGVRLDRIERRKSVQLDQHDAILHLDPEVVERAKHRLIGGRFVVVQAAGRKGVCRQNAIRR